MGLPIILSALHLFPAISGRRGGDRDPEKGRLPLDEDDARAVEDHAQEQEQEQEEDVDDQGTLEDDLDDPLAGERRLHRLASATTGTFFSSTVDTKISSDLFASNQPLWTKIKTYIFPPEESEASLEKFVPNYRWTPIISGVVVPFSILLEIPGLTEHWYIRTEANKVVEIKSNPAILDVGLAVSMACALAANVCLVARFLEKRVKTVTILTILFLTLHDIINIVAVIVFGVQHRFNDGFTYGQSFWLTVCSTIASTITNVTLITDFVRTTNFARSGSGLTRKQRALVIIVITLLAYIALGALVNSLMLHLNFIDGLYFTVVTIETIGFGDIHPINTGTRIFTCFYMAFGIINVGVAVAMTRETVLEGLDLGYRKRMRNLRIKRREARRFRRWEARWRRAVVWRLKAAGREIWVSDDCFPLEGIHFVGLTGKQQGAGEVHWMRRWLESSGLKKTGDEGPIRHIRGHPRGKHLNIDALSGQELEAAALEAGVPLQMFLSPQRRRISDHEQVRLSQSPRENGDKSRLRWFAPRQTETNGWPTSPQTPTHAQLGRMSAMVTKFAMAMTGAHVHMIGNTPETHEQMVRDAERDLQPERDNVWFDEHDPKTNGAGANDKPRDQHTETSNGGTPNHQEDASERSAGGLVVEGSLHPKMPEFVKDAARVRKQQSDIIEAQLSEAMASEERKAYLSKLLVAWSLFLLFWFVGSAIFSSTEGWAYGDAMYFCFLAFTTTGYGDFAPASPAGRSIFVVWALMGVATMTILIAVIEEAGSSKYKHALHSKAFDTAVKKYRIRENRETERITANSRPHAPRAHSDNSLIAATEAAQTTAQQALERLPSSILHQARSFHRHMQYFVNGGENRWDETTGKASGRDTRIPKELHTLLDELGQLEDIGERTKRDIMEDDDARNTLVMLSVERSLRELINAAECALGALAERDGLLALRRQREQQSQDIPSNPEGSIMEQANE